MNKSTQYALVSFAVTAAVLALAHKGTAGVGHFGAGQQASFCGANSGS